MNILYEIQKKLTEIEDPTIKIAFLGEISNFCNKNASRIQSKYNGVFVEVLSNDDINKDNIKENEEKILDND